MFGRTEDSGEREPLLSQTPADDDGAPTQEIAPARRADPVIYYHRSLAGFLSYSAAAETFSIVSVALFLPICLEAFARDNGRLTRDHQQDCKLPAATPGTPPPVGSQNDACEVDILGHWVNTSSFSLFTYSVSVLSQALVFITLGSQANHPATRKAMLFSSALVGGLSQLALLALRSSSPIWITVALISIIGNVAFGLGNVCLNAYLPSLAKSAPAVVQIASRPHHTRSPEADEADEHDYRIAVSQSAGYISALGVGSGYTVGVCALILCLVPVLKLHGSTDSFRIAIASSGATWLLLSIPAYFLLSSTSESPRTPISWSEGWVGLARVLKEAKHLRHTMQYLVAYIFLSDAFATILSTATLFAKTELHMGADKLIVVGILAPLSGVVGAFAVPLLASRHNLSNHRALLSICCVAALVPAYGCLALVFRVPQGHFGSLSTHTEIYGLACLFGFLYGAFQSYSRALYSELIPQGQEARFFSLYAITDKSSSFLGPFLVALIADRTDNLRYGFIVILLGMSLPLPFLAQLDVEGGKEQARCYRIR